MGSTKSEKENSHEFSMLSRVITISGIQLSLLGKHSKNLFLGIFPKPVILFGDDEYFSCFKCHTSKG